DRASEPLLILLAYGVSCPSHAKFYSKQGFGSLQSHQQPHFPFLANVLPGKTLRGRVQNPLLSHGFRAHSKFLFRSGKRPYSCSVAVPPVGDGVRVTVAVVADDFIVSETTTPCSFVSETRSEPRPAVTWLCVT